MTAVAASPPPPAKEAVGAPGATLSGLQWMMPGLGVWATGGGGGGAGTPPGPGNGTGRQHNGQGGGGGGQLDLGGASNGVHQTIGNGMDGLGTGGGAANGAGGGPEAVSRYEPLYMTESRWCPYVSERGPGGVPVRLPADGGGAVLALRGALLRRRLPRLPLPGRPS